MRLIILILALLLILFVASNYLKSTKNTFQKAVEEVDSTVANDKLIDYTKKSMQKISEEADSRMKEAEKVLKDQ